jgi:hypothetical protein
LKEGDTPPPHSIFKNGSRAISALAICPNFKLQSVRSSNMNKNPLNKGALTENAAGIGTVTEGMVEARARELAVIAGRNPPQPSQVEYEQAKRELTGEPELDANEAALELIPESERWDPVPGSTGCPAPESLSEDEDSEGRSESAQLVEEGVKEAEHDQMLQAARAAQEADKREQ